MAREHNFALFVMGNLGDLSPGGSIAVRDPHSDLSTSKKRANGTT